MSTPVIAFDEIDSTNAEARRRAEAGEDGPIWFTAARQTAGRGRRGRVWDTGRGNLAATLLLTTDRPPSDATQLSFVAALAVCDFARAYLPADTVKVKWPNDVMVGYDKVSGILLESGRRADGRLWVAVGVGINLAHHPDDTERPATSFAAHMAGPPPDPTLAIDGRQRLRRLAGRLGAPAVRRARPGLDDARLRPWPARDGAAPGRNGLRHS